MNKRLLIRALIALILLFAAWRGLPEPVGDPSVGGGSLATAWEDGASGVWVEGAGTVVRVLEDDRQGSRHQRFVLSVSEGHTVLISHNIDLARRVDPIRVGDAVEFRGRYEWNSQGGVVHWTHHDPEGRLPGGWIESGGTRVR
ncbi:MAG: DUF3465 domain-containing protein [Gemmatimonadetes bacterium]|nr:DUF3465 domain-containing protein [Gemmatimonadota bacterium]NNM35124.1 DUF3465 domain-containing protein [Gemmatimonadota bacterium]